MGKLKKINLISFCIIGFFILSFTINIPTIISFDNDNHIKKSTILALIPHAPIEILNDDNFTDYGFSGSGTSTSPYIIENYEIITTNERGIFVSETTKYFIIRNCYVDAADYGIYINQVAKSTVTIEFNTCINNLLSGIRIYLTDVFTLVNNNCTNNYDGIYLLSSDDASLVNNTCSNNNHHGLALGFSKNTTVINNNCSGNNDGIHLTGSDDTKLINNTCSSNNNVGIFLDTIRYVGEWHRIPCDDCIVSYNLISNNDNYSIYIYKYCENNTIHHNSIIDNNLEGTSQAYDNGTDNFWFEAATKEGNYWNNWNSKDPYPIDGPANSTDPYPLNEYLERINYGFIIYIPLIGLLAIISRNMRKRNKKSL